MGSAAIVSKSFNRTVQKSVRWMTRRLQKRAPYGAHNPFLEGAFAPVDAECTETALKVHGEIPAQLNGLLTRMGPNPRQVENPGLYNWFTGDGMVHGLRLQNGRALWYRSRFVGVDSVNEALGRPLAPGPRRGLLDIVNTNVIGHAGRIWALVEAGAYPVEMDAELNTLRHGLFDSPLNAAFTAHPHVDPDSGELHAICYDPLTPGKARYLRIGKSGQLVRNVAIPVRHGPMMHDCAITRSKIVILDLPVTFSLARMFKGSQLPYAWNPRHEARVGLLPRDGEAGEVRWYGVDPCFVFHTCNAYELDDGNTVLDVAVHERTLDGSLQGPLEDDRKLTFERWTLDNVSRRVQRRVISDESQDFPRFDERRAGKPYRYAYTVSLGSNAHPGHPGPNALLRHDLQTGEIVRHHYGPQWMSGEVIFVPRQADAQEDQGWLLSYVHGVDGGPSQVVILDAQNIGGAPQAVIELPVRVPLGFHCNWIADAGSA